MNSFSIVPAMLLAIIVCLVLLPGCEKDSPAENLGEGIEEVGEDIQEAAQDARREIEDVTD